MGILEFLGIDFSRLNTPGLIAVIAVAAISAIAWVLVNRRPHFDPTHMRALIGTLLEVRDQLLNPKVRRQIVDFATGRVLLDVPKTEADWGKLIEFLGIRHRQNLHVVGQIRFCLTRRQRRRLDRAARYVETRRMKVVKLFEKLNAIRDQKDEVRIRALVERIARAIVNHLNSVVRFEQLILIAIQSSLDHYSSKLEGA
jgi:hypothetical protein